MQKMVIVAGLALALASQFAQAGGDLKRGKEKSSACVACHGADGNSVLPIYPRLAGQNADYLLHSLKAYQNGKRNNAIMKGIVATLQPQDMEDLAVYFSSQKGLVVKR